MKKKILRSCLSIIGISLCSFLFLNSQHIQASSQKEASVLVCKSPYAARFHVDKDCLGLNKCKREIVTVTQAVAEEEGLTGCGICCKKKSK